MPEFVDVKQLFLEACQNGQIQEVNRYLERGISPNTTNSKGVTALMLACGRPFNHPVVALLLENGANIYAKDLEGKTAIDYAQHPQIVNLLQKYNPAFMNRNQSRPDTQITPDILRTHELEAIIAFCDELKNLKSDINPFIYFKKAQALLELGHTEEGWKVLMISKDIFQENYGTSQEARSWSEAVRNLYLQMLSLQADYYSHDPQASLWLLNEAYHLTEEPEQRYEFKVKRDKIYDQVVFSDKKLGKFIYLEEDFPQFTVGSICSLLVENTGNLNFAGILPQSKTLYVAHPYHTRTYYPFQEAESLLINHQLSEFLQIVQHLGAKKIKIQRAQPLRNSQGVDPAALDATQDPVSSNNKTHEYTLHLEHEFKPTQKPHLPKDLVWYPHQAEWQNLVHARLQNGLLTTEIFLTASRNALGISKEEAILIQKELQLLQDTAYRSKNSVQPLRERRRGRPSRKNEDDNQEDTLVKAVNTPISYKISIEFAALEELWQEINSNTLEIIDFQMTDAPQVRTHEVQDVSSVLKKFVEEINPQPLNQTEEYPTEETPYEDTIYDNWKKQKTQIPEQIQEGLSEEDPIEADNTSPPEDLQYFQTESPRTTEPQEVVSTPEITNQEETPAIQETPVTVLEEEPERVFADADGFSVEERTYFEMLLNAYQDGVISEDVRRVLERRRIKFNISAKRADEIERLMIQKKNLL